MDVEGVVIRGRGHRKHGLFSGFGKLETIYIGAKRSNQITCYNKFGGIRLECRPKKKRPIADLPSILNPFEKVRVIPASTITSMIEPPWGDHVLNTIRVLGFTKGTLGLANAAAMTAALRDPTNSVLPPPDEVWKQWPLAIEKAGLLFVSPTTSPDELPNVAMEHQQHRSE